MNPLKIVLIVFALIVVYNIVHYMTVNPYVLTAVLDGKTSTTFTADDLEATDPGMPASNFSYSVWFYVNDWNYRYNKPKIIFGRMGTAGDKESAGDIQGISGLGPCPVVMLAPIQNNLSVSLNCFPGINNIEEYNEKNGPVDEKSSTVHTCTVGNISIQRWVLFTMSVYNRTLDLYIDGKLVKTCLLPGIAKVSTTSKLHLTPMGGFAGWTSRFQYYASALNPQDVWNIYVKGYDTWFGNIFGSYELQLALLENGETTRTITI